MIPLREMQVPQPAITSLEARSPLDTAALHALDMAIKAQDRVKAGRELLSEGQKIGEHLLLLGGWAMRTRILRDGRRQILAFVLPGDFLTPDHAHATSDVVALTDLRAAIAPDPAVSPALQAAYDLARRQEETRLIAQITRIGQMSAQERIIDILLEFHDRLAPAGLLRRGRFPVPLTQDVLAEALGLTSVHVNRTLMTLRRRGDLEWRAREITLPDVARLRRSIGVEQREAS